MRYLDYNEQIQHRTGDLPLAYYYVDEHHPRYRMQMHWHRETELLWMRRGALRLHVNGEPLELGPGDLAVLGEGVLHGGDADEGVYECVVLDPYALLMRIEPCSKAVRTVMGTTMVLTRSAIAAYPGFSSALERLYAAAGRGVQGDELKVVGALYEVFGFLVDHGESAVRMDANGAVTKAEQIKPALEYIEKNYGSRLSLEILARQAGMSAKYFCRCFRAVVHRSPIDYVNNYRVERACVLLTTTDMTVAEIAQRCGYNDSSFFIKQFRRCKNTTPRKYRFQPSDESLTPHGASGAADMT